MPRRSLRSIVADFDMDLSTSPAYIEYAALERRHACRQARASFRRVFGRDAKIPVNQRNWELMQEFENVACNDLRRGWIVDRFNDGFAANDKRHNCRIAVDYYSYDPYPWSNVETALRQLRPDWYAAQAANKPRTKKRVTK